MTKAMIQRIKKIEDYRIFKGWTQSPETEFARVNLIYGQNGSGKSTLANLVLGCAAYAADERHNRDNLHREILKSGVQLSIRTSEPQASDVSLSDSQFWKRVRVFNKDFIRQNLALEAEGGPQPRALMTIGKISIDAETRLAELRPELEDVHSKIEQEKRAVKLADDTASKNRTEVAKAVTNDLLGTRVPEYNPRSYTARQVEKLLDQNEADLEAVLAKASTDLATDRQTATSKTMASVSLNARGSIAAAKAVDEARDLLTTDVIVQVIESLRGHPKRSSWVQQGIPLHDGLTECLFCGQPLTAGRREELAKHFDTSLTNLQRSIDDLVNHLNASAKASENYLNSIPSDEAIYGNLRTELQEARAGYQKAHDSYSQAAQEITTTLKEKKNNPFTNIILNSDLTLSAPETAKLEKIVAAHVERIKTHDKEAREAARRVELYHIKNFASEHERLKKEAEARRATVQRLEEKAADLRRQILTLENVETDPAPGADELTGYVARLLSRNELTFTATADRKHYQIYRNGTPATNLSEGEQTAIALLYFLVSIREDKTVGEEPIVIIDDPVSSLDNGILFGASAHLWTELVTNTYASQVFLMTHNFELFRQWLVQMEPLAKRNSKTEGDYRAYEIRATHTDDGHGNVKRTPILHRLKILDKKTKKLRSLYHYLFDQVAQGLCRANAGLGLAEQMEVMALMPNAARRMLESFLSFRCPHEMGSFHGSMRTVLDGNPGLDQAVRTHVERYLHAYSHLEEADILHPLDPSESTVVLRSLFHFMDHVDQEHVSSMCKALGIDKTALLRASRLTPSLEDPHG